jgi:hypothetical protein
MDSHFDIDHSPLHRLKSVAKDFEVFAAFAELALDALYGFSCFDDSVLYLRASLVSEVPCAGFHGIACFVDQLEGFVYHDGLLLWVLMHEFAQAYD